MLFFPLILLWLGWDTELLKREDRKIDLWVFMWKNMSSDFPRNLWFPMLTWLLKIDFFRQIEMGEKSVFEPGARFTKARSAYTTADKSCFTWAATINWLIDGEIKVETNYTRVTVTLHTLSYCMYKFIGPLGYSETFHSLSLCWTTPTWKIWSATRHDLIYSEKSPSCYLCARSIFSVFCTVLIFNVCAYE